MKKISAHSKTSLFLMEMIFVLLFLALSSAACIRIFAAAKNNHIQAHERQNFWCPAESRTKLHASNRNPSGSRLAFRTRKLIHQHYNN